MNFFYVMNGKRLKQYFIVLMALLFAAGVIYTEKDNVTVFSYSEPSAIYSVQTDKKVIALTFDISWGDIRTEPIVKVLEDKKVNKATFFLSSPWAQTHLDIVTRISKDGFEIGSHGHKHVNYSSLSDEEIRGQIQKAHQILTAVTGKAPNLIRLPNGDFDKRVLQISHDLGYTVIQWDTDSLDWMNKGTDQIIDRVVSGVHPGDIVLLHASDSCKQTADALPVIIDKLRDKGYQFVTVSDLLKMSQVNSQQVEDQALKQIF